MIVEAGSTIVDAFGNQTAQLEGLAAAGVAGISRYIAPLNNLTAPKILRRAEIDRAHALGVGVQLNFEWYAARAKDGYDAGTEDARTTLDWLEAQEIPDHVPVIISHDSDTRPSTIAAQVDYQGRFRELLAGRPVGAYIDNDGGRALEAGGLVDVGIWGPAALGWNSGPAPASLYLQQRVGLSSKLQPFTGIGEETVVRSSKLQPFTGIGEDTVVRSFDLWAGELHAADQNGQTTKPKDSTAMRILHPDGRQFVTNGPILEPIIEPAAHWLERLGPPELVNTADDLAKLDAWIEWSALKLAEAPPVSPPVVFPLRGTWEVQP
ncbi:MAG: hypothetical protein AB7R77_12550 [Ilumatobacteraceae bacterium]